MEARQRAWADAWSDRTGAAAAAAAGTAVRTWDRGAVVGRRACWMVSALVGKTVAEWESRPRMGNQTRADVRAGVVAALEDVAVRFV